MSAFDTAGKARGGDYSRLALTVVVAGGITLAGCIGWAISQSSGLSNMSAGDLVLAAVVFLVGLLPFVVLALGAPTLGRATTVAATALFAVAFIAAYGATSDSSTGSGLGVITLWFLLTLVAFTLIGVTHLLRAARRRRRV